MDGTAGRGTTGDLTRSNQVTEHSQQRSCEAMKTSAGSADCRKNQQQKTSDPAQRDQLFRMRVGIQPYRVCQRFCKSLGLRAVGKHAVLQQRIIEHYEGLDCGRKRALVATFCIHKDWDPDKRAKLASSTGESSSESSTSSNSMDRRKVSQKIPLLDPPNGDVHPSMPALFRLIKRPVQCVTWNARTLVYNNSGGRKKHTIIRKLKFLDGLLRKADIMHLQEVKRK